MWNLFLESTALLAAAASLAWAARRRPASWRHLIWLTALLGVPLLPLVSRWTPVAPPDAILPISVGAGTAAHATASTAWAPSVWAAGSLLLALRVLVVQLLWRSRVRGATASATAGAVISPHVTGPMVWGITAPRIVLPESSREWGAALLESVLRHEGAHVARRDPLWHFAAGLVCVFAWFQPLVWWAARRLREEAENACDDDALAAASAADYAEHLVQIARAASGMPSMAPAMAGTSALERRVTAILDPHRAAGPLSRRRAFLTVATVLAALAAASCVKQDDRVYKAGKDGATSPKLIKKLEPSYTEQARKDKIQGVVVLHIEVSAAGSPRNIKVIKGLDPGLDAEAVKAVNQWTFQPGTKDGKPVAVGATIEVKFRLL